jgi:hypothetical protein
MVQEESNAKIDKLIKALEKDFNAETIIKSLMDLREDALKDKDPLLAKVLRLASEYIKEEGCFDHTVEKEENEEGGSDKNVLLDIQNGFKVKILELPKELDTSLYM